MLGLANCASWVAATAAGSSFSRMFDTRETGGLELPPLLDVHHWFQERSVRFLYDERVRDRGSFEDPFTIVPSNEGRPVQLVQHDANASAERKYREHPSNRAAAAALSITGEAGEAKFKLDDLLREHNRDLDAVMVDIVRKAEAYAQRWLKRCCTETSAFGRVEPVALPVFANGCALPLFRLMTCGGLWRALVAYTGDDDVYRRLVRTACIKANGMVFARDQSVYDKCVDAARRESASAPDKVQRLLENDARTLVKMQSHDVRYEKLTSDGYEALLVRDVQANTLDKNVITECSHNHVVLGDGTTELRGGVILCMSQMPTSSSNDLRIKNFIVELANIPGEKASIATRDELYTRLAEIARRRTPGLNKALAYAIFARAGGNKGQGFVDLFRATFRLCWGFNADVDLPPLHERSAAPAAASLPASALLSINDRKREREEDEDEDYEEDEDEDDEEDEDEDEDDDEEEGGGAASKDQYNYRGKKRFRIKCRFV